MNSSANDFNEFYAHSAPNKTGSPERNLILAILERAILDYTGNDPEQAEDAELWLFGGEIDPEPEEFTFPWVCNELDLDLKDVTQKIRLMPRRGNSRVPPWYQTAEYQAQKMGAASSR